MNVSSVLEGAADLIERDGWFGHDGKGDRATGHRKCALIALTDMAGTWNAGVRAFNAAIGGSADTYRGDIVEWNNAPDRTKEEVIAMLRAVAATERAREASPVRVVAETQDALPESVRS